MGKAVLQDKIILQGFALIKHWLKPIRLLFQANMINALQTAKLVMD
jgi:hypothetical protein